MSEEQPQEVKQTQPKISVVDNVRILVKAQECCAISERYEKSHDRPMVFYHSDGKQIAKNPTLELYIKKAEENFVKSRAKEILIDAQTLLDNEIEEIREMLG